MTIRTRAIVGLTLIAALGGATGLAQAQQSQPMQESGRVISSTPIRNSTGSTSYSVTYEYQGRQYTTRMDNPPGQTIALQVSPMGVSTSPVADQPQITSNSSYGSYGSASQNADPAPWANVVPEPGVVVGAGSPPPPAVVYGAPAYVSAPVYAPAPVYVQPAYGYGYAAPYYAAPPIGVSLNLGYSRGWGGYGYGYRGWGGGYGYRGWR